MKTLAVMVTTPPFSNLTTTAYHFIEKALEQGINVAGVFFYQDGVLNANSNVAIPNDEFQMNAHWQQLHQHYKLPLYLCYTAAEKRGLTEETPANINEIFIPSGLGELVQLSNNADRMVQF